MANSVQDAGTSGLGASALSASWLSNTTTGNLVVVGVSITNAATLGTVTSVVDTQSNTYVKAVSKAGTGAIVVGAELWYATNIIGGAGSVTVNHVLDSTSIFVREYSGAFNYLDVTSSKAGSSTTPDSGATGATAQGNELIVVASADAFGGTQTYAAAGAYGNIVGTTTTVTGVAMEDNLTIVTGAQTGTLTLTVAQEWVCLAAAFKRIANPRLTSQGMGGM